MPLAHTDAQAHAHVDEPIARTAPSHYLALLPHFWNRQDLDELSEDRYLIGRDLARLFLEIDGVGHRGSADGTTDEGYFRFPWTREDALMRLWFARKASWRGMRIEVDNAGNQWAWWEPEGTSVSAQNPGIVCGSHLDSVAGGGPFDGPLGVISAFCAVDQLRREGFEPTCPIGIVNCSNEEGSRFGAALFGTRVLTGVIDGQDALSRVDAGQTLEEALRGFAGQIKDALVAMNASNKDVLAQGARAPEPGAYGTDEEALSLAKAFLELHIDLGIHTERTGRAVAMQSYIWPHGRWRIDIAGQANHAGCTPMDFRHDPLPVFARICLAVQQTATDLGMLATVGRVDIEPSGINVIASHATAFLDARAADESTLDAFLERVSALIASENEESPCEVTFSNMTRTAATYFDAHLQKRAREAAMQALGCDVEPFGLGAGHDAGVLETADIPSAMFIVCNASGQAHTPYEFARLSDCVDGVVALAAALKELA